MEGRHGVEHLQACCLSSSQGLINAIPQLAWRCHPRLTLINVPTLRAGKLHPQHFPRVTRPTSRTWVSHVLEHYANCCSWPPYFIFIPPLKTSSSGDTVPLSTRLRTGLGLQYSSFLLFVMQWHPEARLGSVPKHARHCTDTKDSFLASNSLPLREVSEGRATPTESPTALLLQEADRVVFAGGQTAPGLLPALPKVTAPLPFPGEPL